MTTAPEPPSPFAAEPPSACRQVYALLLRKEWVLVRRRPISTLCVLVLPMLLGMTAVLGANLSTVNRFDETSYAPMSAAGAFSTIGPAAFIPLLLGERLSSGGPFAPPKGALGTPQMVPPLDLYLTYAHAVGLAHPKRALPPFDGASCLAVAPDTPTTRKLVSAALARRPVGAAIGALPPTAARAVEAELEALLRSAGVPIPHFSLRSLAYPNVSVCYHRTEQELAAAAAEAGGVWAAAVFGGADARSPPPRSWELTLRFNFTAVPSTRTLYDRFASGLSSRFFKYYTSGFLSLQQAASERPQPSTTLHSPPRAPSRGGRRSQRRCGGPRGARRQSRRRPRRRRRRRGGSERGSRRRRAGSRRSCRTCGRSGCPSPSRRTSTTPSSTLRAA